MKFDPFYLLFLLLWTSCYANPAQPSQEDEWHYKIHVIDVETSIGDAILIETNQGKTMLIDAGYGSSGREIVVPYLESHNITHIDFLVASHYHADHIGGIPEVVRALGIDSIFTVYDRGNHYDGGPYQAYEEAVEPKRRTIETGDTLWFSSTAYAACLGVNGCGIEDPGENASSVILHINLEFFSGLFCQKIGSKAQIFTAK